ncbi:DUF1344 domain-containing protein [Aquibium sp. LZ166]|uniref:DUF1344 domain-containing protein n=1 Tax=Aquibium pacificus TaxID=3153579 RepID=A0ABV3SQ58_9HYPH
MRALLIPTTLATLLAAAPFALAATQDTTGVVRNFDQKAETLTLNDGVIYHLAPGYKNSALKSGERVRISWQMKDGMHSAQDVTILK